MAQNPIDIAIIGAGPAGLAAALYCARDRYDTVVLEKFAPGETIDVAERIENYPALKRISGPDMVAAMLDQASTFGAKVNNNAEVTALAGGPVR